MKVETDLTPRQDVFLQDQRFDILFSFVVVEASIVRMRADSGVNRFVLLTDIDGAFEHSRARISRSHVEYCRYTRRPRPLNHLLPIRVELRPIDVRMRINKHSLCSLCAFLWLTLSAHRSERLQ